MVRSPSPLPVLFNELAKAKLGVRLQFSDVPPDALGELLRSDALGVAKDVRVMLQRDVRISMPHKPGDDVDDLITSIPAVLSPRKMYW
jgi:hypothetical protein